MTSLCRRETAPFAALRRRAAVGQDLRWHGAGRGRSTGRQSDGAVDAALGALVRIYRRARCRGRRAAFARGGTRASHRHHAVAFRSVELAVEMHQCYLDLVTAGTACLLFEEAAPGESSAFRFTAKAARPGGLRRRAERPRRHLRRNEYTIPQLTAFRDGRPRSLAERKRRRRRRRAQASGHRSGHAGAQRIGTWRWPNPAGRHREPRHGGAGGGAALAAVHQLHR